MHRADDDNPLITIAPEPAMKRLPAPPLPVIRIRYAEQIEKPVIPWLNRPGMSLAALAIITAFGTFLRFYNLTFPALWNDETLVFWRVCGRYGQMLVPLHLDGFPPLHYSLFWLVMHPIPTDAYVNQRILGGIVGLVVFATLLVTIGAGIGLGTRALSKAGKSPPRRLVAFLLGVIGLAVYAYEIFASPTNPVLTFFLPEHGAAAIQALHRSPWLPIGALLVMVGMVIAARAPKQKTAVWSWTLAGIVLQGVGLAICSFAVLHTYWCFLEWPNTAILFPASLSPGQYQHFLTPWIMRTIPAVFGALTVPAIYFLARQMLPRGTSLVSATFAACSAFMLFYSRDGKMYSDSWLFVTLNLGSLLWWFRTGRSTAWLCWIAAGCAMVGLQATSLLIPGISILLLLTQRTLRWNRVLIFIAGLAVIYAGPAVYYSKFNIWTERVEDVGWSASGLGWVGGFFNGGRTGVEHYQYATSAFLMGYEYPRDDYVDKHYGAPIPDALITGPETAFAEILTILAIGLLPWPMMLRPRRDLDPPPEPGWRVYLWIAGIVLPLSYGFYCYSVTGFVSPWRWWHDLRESLDWIGFALLGAIASTFVVFNALHPKRWPALARFVQCGLVTAALFCLCLAIYKKMAPMAAEAFFQGKPFQSVWTPRYLGTLWPMACLGVAALLMRLPTRPVRIACIFFVMAVNLALFGLRMTIGTEPPIDIQAKDEWLAQDVDGKKSKVHTFDYIAHGGIAVAESALDVNSEKVTAGRYYLVDLANDAGCVIPNDPERRPLSPNVFERALSYFGRTGFGFNLRQEYNWWQFKQDVTASPQLERIIIWTRVSPSSSQREMETEQRPKALRPPVIDHDYILQSALAVGYDPIRKLLPPGWKLPVGNETIYAVHNPWDWRTFAYWIRREYVKTPK